jgi:hypothetical protein
MATRQFEYVFRIRYRSSRYTCTIPSAGRMNVIAATAFPRTDCGIFEAHETRKTVNTLPVFLNAAILTDYQRSRGDHRCLMTHTRA